MTAQIRVGQELVKPKAIHVFKNGEWQKKRMGYIYKNGQWMPVINYELWLYKNGVEFENYHVIEPANGTFTKMSNHFLFQVGGSTSYDRDLLISTDRQIDTSGFSKLFIEVETNDSTSLQFGVGKEKDAFDLIKYSERGMPRQIIEADLTDFLGAYFVLLKASTTYSQKHRGIVKVYNIWLG